MQTTDSRSHWRDKPVLAPDQQQLFNRILSAILLLIIVVWIGGMLFSNDGGYAINLYTEVISIFFTVAIIEVLNERRARRALKRDLIYRMGSNVSEEVVRAFEEVRRNGWLYDGSLDKANLCNANMQGIKLSRSMLFDCDFAVETHSEPPRKPNLSGAVMIKANLIQVSISDAIMKESVLWYANLQESKIFGCDLEKAQIVGANLYRANLFLSSLKGANLTGANLEGADLTHTEFDENTILPDGNKWVAHTDLTIFTHRSHPNFWRSTLVVGSYAQK